MIYTLTVNPSLDYFLSVENVKFDSVNRSTEEKIFAGGKGVNVSIVLSRLGLENTALGFLAGFTGTEIDAQLSSFGVKTDFVYLPTGNSRINIKLLSDTETEINGCGPFITADALEKLEKKLDLIKDGDILIMAGSIPAFLPETFYSEIMERLGKKNIRFVVDASGPLLKNSVKAKPFLIKPNEKEMQEFFSLKFMYEDSLNTYGKRLLEFGAQNVLLSLGGRGAILYCEDGRIIRQGIPSGDTVYTVGAGDSMLAGFIAEYCVSGDYVKSLRLAVAAGSASAYSIGLAEKEKILELLDNLPPPDIIA